MEDEESLQAGTVVSQLANTIEDEVNDFLLVLNCYEGIGIMVSKIKNCNEQ